MRLILTIVCFSIFITSCKKATDWDIDASVPIAKSHLNISNFFGDTIFQADNSGLLHIAFSKEVINYTMDSLVNLPDTTVSLGFTLPGSYSSTPGAQIYSNAFTNDKEITFDVNNGVQLNKAIVRSGTLKVEYFNSCTQPLNFNYTINSASIWGNLFHINQVIPKGSISSPATFTKYYDLSGYNINLTGLANNKVNTLVQTYTISADASGQPDLFLQDQGLEVKLSFVDIVPEYVQGYFGQQNLNFGPDSSQLNFLNNFNANNLVLSQAAINFRIINEFGIDLQSSITSIKSIKTNPINVISLNSGNLLQSINVNRGAKTNNPASPVFPAVKQVNINSSNSNINSFIQNLPNYFGYAGNAKINPLGNISGANDFAYYGHGLKVIADVDIPLALSANYFSLVNISKVDLTQLKELKNVNHAEINVQARNNYPFKTTLQGYMLNENGQIIDSLFLPGQNIIQPAVTDAANNILSFVDSKLTADFPKEKLNNLMQCKQIKFVSYLYLTNQPTQVKLDVNSYLDLIVSVNVNYNVSTK